MCLVMSSPCKTVCVFQTKRAYYCRKYHREGFEYFVRFLQVFVEASKYRHNCLRFSNTTLKVCSSDQDESWSQMMADCCVLVGQNVTADVRLNVF